MLEDFLMKMILKAFLIISAFVSTIAPISVFAQSNGYTFILWRPQNNKKASVPISDFVDKIIPLQQTQSNVNDRPFIFKRNTQKQVNEERSLYPTYSSYWQLDREHESVSDPYTVSY